MEDTAGVVRLGMPYDRRPESKDLQRFLTDYCKHWRDIGLLLGLKSSVLDLVASAHPMQDRECFRATLEKWLQLNVGVTWSNLELAITNANRENLGLQPLTTIPTSQSEVTVMKSHDYQPRQGYERSQVEISSVITESVELTKARKRLSSIDEIEAEFGIMVADVQEALENNKVNVNKLLIKLKSSSAVRERKIPLFDEHTFEKITSIEKLFETLSGYWHLFDYDVLLYLVKTAGCEEAKTIYDNFLASFDSSMIMMSNYQLILQYDEFNKENIVPGTCRLRIKVARDECTIEIEKKVKEVISKCFNLEKYALICKGLKQGCIELMYQISHSVKSYMLQYKLNSDAVLQLKIHKITAIKFDCMELSIPKDFSDEESILSWSICATFSSDLNQLLNLLHENLKKWFRKLKSTRSMVEETIWSLFPTYPCIGYLSAFHDLSQHGSYTSTLKLLSSVQELFEGTNECPKHILIEGHTGIGKTTLCKEICYQWAENNLFTSDKLVLLLLLQDPMAQKITSEYELAKYFTTSFDFIEPFSEYLISSCGAEVTIVIDSYDQLNEELQDNGFIKDLLEGTRLPKAQIVIASNPFVSYHLHNCVDRRVELFELVKSMRNKFISTALKKFPNILKLLQEHFRKFPEVDILSCVPINMAIVVSLCGILTSFPENAQKMYEKFCEVELNFSLILHNQANRMWYRLQYDARKHLDYFAYLALIKNKPIFLEADLLDMCKEYPTCYGFLQSTECYSPAYHNKRMLFNFLCHGVQQYLSTSYITRFSLCEVLQNCLATKALSLFHFMPINWSIQVLNMCILGKQYWYEDEDTILNIIDDLDKSSNSYNIHLHKLKQFELTKQKSDIMYSIGSSINDSSIEKFDINSEQDKLIPKYVFDSGYTSSTVSPKSSVINIMLQYPPFLSLCLYQIFSSSLVEHNIVKDSKIDFTHYYLLPYHITSLGLYLLRTNQVQAIYELHLGDCSIGDYGLYLLSSYLCIDTDYSRRSRLTMNLCKNNLTAASALIISNIIDHLKPFSLGLGYNNLTDAGLAKICNAVIRNQVHELNLAENGLTAQGTKSISLMINILKELDISHNNIGDLGAKTLSQGLAHTMTLKRLDIGHSNIGLMGASKLAHVLAMNSSLEILCISANCIDHNGVIGFATALRASKTLRELDLSHNNIGDQGGITLSQGLAHTVALKCFDISYCNIGEAGACELARALTINSSLEILRMKGNLIGHTGAAKLNAALCINNTLKEFSASGVQ